MARVWKQYAIRLRGSYVDQVAGIADVMKVDQGAVVRGLVMAALDDGLCSEPGHVERVRAAIGAAALEGSGVVRVPAANHPWRGRRSDVQIALDNEGEA